MLKKLRMPTMKDMWHAFAERAQREGWSHEDYLAQLAEQELADRAHRQEPSRRRDPPRPRRARLPHPSTPELPTWRRSSRRRAAIWPWKRRSGGSTSFTSSWRRFSSTSTASTSARARARADLLLDAPAHHIGRSRRQEVAARLLGPTPTRRPDDLAAFGLASATDSVS